jgi:hypothetical protein
MQLTERDIEILRQVYKHRFLRSSHAVRLLDASEGKILRRLQLLFHHGYLHRPAVRRQFYGWGGGEPLVYTLAPKGADVLKHFAAVQPKRAEWLSQRPTERNESVEHGLMVTELIVRLQASCRQNSRVRFMDADEITRELLDELPQDRRVFRWRVNVTHQGFEHNIEVVPDQVFGLHYLDRPRGENKVYFFLEADRGTMPVVRSTLNQSSILKKLLGYYETWQQELLLRRFGIDRFRVVTVTTSFERMLSMVEANRQVNGGKGSGLFLFAARDHLERFQNLLAAPFASGRIGEITRLAEGL